MSGKRRRQKQYKLRRVSVAKAGFARRRRRWILALVITGAFTLAGAALPKIIDLFKERLKPLMLLELKTLYTQQDQNLELVSEEGSANPDFACSWRVTNIGTDPLEIVDYCLYVTTKKGKILLRPMRLKTPNRLRILQRGKQVQEIAISKEENFDSMMRSRILATGESMAGYVYFTWNGVGDFTEPISDVDICIKDSQGRIYHKPVLLNTPSQSSNRVDYQYSFDQSRYNRWESPVQDLLTH